MALILQITPYKLGDQPTIEKIPKELLTHLGEDGIRDMISKLYECLKVSPIKHLFPIHSDNIFNMAKKHSADFFIQICGGEQHYQKNRGNPKMRQRHMPFKIDADARIIWLECFAKTIKDLDAPEVVLNSFWKYLDSFSALMVNSK